MRNKLDLLIRGDLVLENGIARNCSVGIKNGVIVGLYSPGEKMEAQEFMDFQEFLVFQELLMPMCTLTAFRK